MPKLLKVFISSTSQDLVAHRAVAGQVILDLQWHPEMMEHFGAGPLPTVAACESKVADCDLVIAIVGFRKGWTPAVAQGGNGVDSITALELAHAHSRRIPILGFFAHDDTWPGKFYEKSDPERNWIESFRGNFNRLRHTFQWEDPSASETERLPAFRATLRQALVAHKASLIAGDSAAGMAVDRFDAAEQSVRRGKSVIFLGAGIFGAGLLSSEALAKALDAGDDQPLATAAEYSECVYEREEFLQRFHRVLTEQSRQAQPTTVHQLLLAVEKPPLIVSAAFDLVLERALQSAGRPYVVVTHVVRSREHDPDCRILVLREDAKPEICRVNQVQFAPHEYVIYKPLGSPLLHDRLDPDLELDTVVVTEADHLAFLARLENPEAGIPHAFTALFRSKAWLFLGYTLDVWHYRLVAHVLRAVGRAVDTKRDRPRLAIRCCRSRMESLAWDRVPAKLIHMDPSEFCARVMRNMALAKDTVARDEQPSTAG